MFGIALMGLLGAAFGLTGGLLNLGLNLVEWSIMILPRSITWVINLIF